MRLVARKAGYPSPGRLDWKLTVQFPDSHRVSELGLPLEDPFRISSCLTSLISACFLVLAPQHKSRAGQLICVGNRAKITFPLALICVMAASSLTCALEAIVD